MCDFILTLGNCVLTGWVPGSVLDVKARLLAEQLTLLEAEFHARVRHCELFEMQWEKKPENAPNVNAMTDYFNRVSLWVATQVAREESPKLQAKVVAKFIKVAEHLMILRNYNSCVQIMSGLSNVAIQRLKRLQKVTISDHPKDSFDELTPDDRLSIEFGSQNVNLFRTDWRQI